jgi:hypothetical protein
VSLVLSPWRSPGGRQQQKQLITDNVADGFSHVAVSSLPCADLIP